MSVSGLNAKVLPVCKQNRQIISYAVCCTCIWRILPFISVHWSPEKPLIHLHVYLPSMESVQIPSFWQGKCTHPVKGKTLYEYSWIYIYRVMTSALIDVKQNNHAINKYNFHPAVCLTWHVRLHCDREPLSCRLVSMFNAVKSNHHSRRIPNHHLCECSPTLCPASPAST